ncbi:hypothetical protein [Nocardia wallacei]|uniref:hypothetical protein n=1 Tax=Nocardia wallacei TaxID=480035 RepID=UPI002456B9FE|nr:hypothetical protein [Nocardia wallacei]
MTEGIAIEVEDGSARIEFLDKALRGETLARLLDVAGPHAIRAETRGGDRKGYVVPEWAAIQAGLLAPPKIGKTKTSTARTVSQ